MRKIFYVSRRANFSGYYILRQLIAQGVPLAGVILPKKRNLWEWPFFGPLYKALYRLRCAYQNADPCKCLCSEEKLARQAGLTVYAVPTMKSPSFLKWIKHEEPDVIFLGGGWPELIPGEVIETPKEAVYNTHPSLLPEYRGTSITRWQVLGGVERSGTTVHKVDTHFDRGPIVAQKALELPRKLSPQELFRELGLLGGQVVGQLFKDTDNLDPAKLSMMPQEKVGKYHKQWQWTPSELRINWENDLQQIESFILANHQESNKYDGPWCILNGQSFIVREAKFNPEQAMSVEDSVRLIGDDIEIKRKGRKGYLTVSQIQVRDKLRPYRRALSPANFDLQEPLELA